MRLFGFEITRKSAVAALGIQQFFPWIREPFAGAWQRNMELESERGLLASSAVYSCATRITEDIGSLEPVLKRQNRKGVWERDSRNPIAAVLRKPNRYQTRIHFLRSWVASLLLNGNAYVLKDREGGTVARLHVLDPRLVTPMVTEDGAIYYQVSPDRLSGVFNGFTVPDTEIIHDRLTTLWHPLIGVSRIYAAALSGTQGLRIQHNSGKFFENMSRPSGMLTAPTKIPTETAQRLKAEFESGFSGGNIGRLFVAGDGLSYQAMTIPAADAQLIEQLKWTVEDIARCFHMPLYKINAGPMPTFNNISSLNQDYYDSTLRSIMEGIELALKEGLGLAEGYKVDFDLEPLLRMDPLGRADFYERAVRSGWMAPNEARLRENMGPVKGGDSPMIQQQNYSLEALAKRDAKDDPFGKEPPALPAPEPTEDAPEDIERVVDAFLRKELADVEYA